MAVYKQDDIKELYITGYGASGEGIAKEGEFVFFVPFALKGERVKAKVKFVNRKNLVFCELKEVIEESEKRVKPVCNRFTRCGGCDMLHLDYGEQLKIKKDNITALFRKNAGTEVAADDVVPCSKPLGYRNKIQIPFGTVNGETAMGFFRENSHKIVSVTKCFLHGEWVEKLIKVFLEFAKAHGLKAYDDETKKGLLRHMVARKLGNNYSIVVVTNEEKLPYERDLIKRLDKETGDCYALYNSVKKEHDNVIMGKSVITLKAKDIYADVMGIKMKINPFSFLQLNDEIRDRIYKRIVDEICEEKGEGEEKVTVIDAYAGVGALGAVLAKKGATVYNIEIVKEATEDGEALAKANGVESRVKNINGDAAKILPELIKEIKGNKGKDNGSPKSGNAPIIILDPPRKGCDEKVLETINGITGEAKIYYISCNPATLTRDIKKLSEGGYEIGYVTPYDMFPNTKHVETLVLMKKRQDIEGGSL